MNQIIEKEFAECVKRNIILLDRRLAYIPGHILEVLNAGLEGAVTSDLLMRASSRLSGKKGQEDMLLNQFT